MTELLIRGGTVIDGTGAPGRLADLRLRGGRIIEIAPNLQSRGEAVIDASGAIVAPGFIDCHTHFDATIFWDPICDPMPQHGVTTVLIGNCSLGLAPVRSAERHQVTDVFSYIEDIPSAAFDAAVPWNWESFDDYAVALNGMPLGVNVATLVAHSLLRVYVMGSAAWERAATSEEADRIALELRRALDAGALGMSVSLLDKDRQGRRVPSYYADDAELDKLFKEIGARQGLFQLVASSQASMPSDIERAAKFAKRHGVTVLHNALLQVVHDPGHAPAMVAQLKALQAGGAKAYSMMSPKPFDIEVNFDNTLCFMKLPVWNELIQASRDGKRAMLTDGTWRERARREVDSCTDSPMFPVNRPQDIRIIAAEGGANRAWIGRSFGELVSARGGNISDVLGDWLLENEFETRFTLSLGNTDPEKMGALLKEPVVVVGGSDAGAHVQMFCAAGDTTLFLTRYVRERGDFTLEAAIHQLTGRQADILNLPDRGRIALGKAADLVVFALDDLTFEAERLVSDLPGNGLRFTRPSGGFRYTLVNGVIVQEYGEATGALPAKFLGTQ